MIETQTCSPAGAKRSYGNTHALALFRTQLQPDLYRAKALLRANRIQASKPSVELEKRAREATRDAYFWVTQHTKTYNEQWKKQGRKSPYENFPSANERPDLPPIFELLASDEPVLWLEKSRTMMESWAIVAYLTLNAMTVPLRGVVLQCQKENKAKQLIKYAKCLYSQQPQWLQDAFPLSKPLHSQSDLSFEWADGGYFVGIPGGADQMRSYHPWAVYNDESSFQPDAGECYNEYLAAGPEKIIFCSSAGPGWFADARRDIVVNCEE